MRLIGQPHSWPPAALCLTRPTLHGAVTAIPSLSDGHFLSRRPEISAGRRRLLCPLLPSVGGDGTTSSAKRSLPPAVWPQSSSPAHHTPEGPAACLAQLPCTAALYPPVPCIWFTVRCEAGTRTAPHPLPFHPLHPWVQIRGSWRSRHRDG